MGWTLSLLNDMMACIEIFLILSLNHITFNGGFSWGKLSLFILEMQNLPSKRSYNHPFRAMYHLITIITFEKSVTRVCGTAY